MSVRAPSSTMDREPEASRIYHPWHLWEDYAHNFYGGVKDWKKDETLALYADLLRDLPRFESALQTVIREWRHSNEHNLSNAGLNRVAYLGQCACALLYGVPHKESRGGYQLLTDAEKAAADAMAQKYLDLWLSEHPQCR